MTKYTGENGKIMITPILPKDLVNCMDEFLAQEDVDTLTVRDLADFIANWAAENCDYDNMRDT